MKQTKKFMSLLLALVMVLSLTNGLTVKAAEAAADTITVTLRVEQDEATMVPPTKVTLSKEDLKDYGWGQSTEKLTPMHALAKYMEEKCGATDENIGKFIDAAVSYYGGTQINKISVKGDITEENFDSGASVSKDASVYWMISANNCSNLPNKDDPNASYNAGTYPLQNDDTITFYGLWGGVYDPTTYAVLTDSYFTAFDKTDYEAETNKECSIKLNGAAISNYTETEAKNPVTDAVILVGKYSDTASSVVKTTALSDYKDIKTNSEGTASITFKEAGTYVLSAYRTIEVDGEDGQKISHDDISRPYAIVTVTDPKKEEQSGNPVSSDTNANNAANTNNTNANNTTGTDNTNAGNTTNANNATAESTTAESTTADSTSASTDDSDSVTVAKPAKVTSVKASVAKKIKNKKKSVTLSWKKLSKVTGYQIYLSKKKNSGYKKTATVKAAKKTLKLKKGTYYVKVRAYNKKDSTTIYGAFSKVVKVSVKK